jgi:hypothetical protein
LCYRRRLDGSRFADQVVSGVVSDVVSDVVLDVVSDVVLDVVSDVVSNVVSDVCQKPSGLLVLEPETKWQHRQPRGQPDS